MYEEQSISIAELIFTKITSGLARKSVVKCSDWAERYRIMGNESPFPGPWRFPHYPWTRGMHDSDAEMNIGQKAAQMSYTETVLNRTLYNLDIHSLNCLYVLPSWRPDACDFSAGRFNPAIELSPHIKEMFSDVSNVGHKRAGTANLYLRGSKSKSQLKSVPINMVVIDEKDEMPPLNVPLAFERQSGQSRRQSWQISTPTYPEYGINADFLTSSQNHFFFKCPHCSKFTELIFPDCIVVTAEKITDTTLKDSHLICKECKAKLEHNTKIEWLNSDSQWVESYTQRDVKGWYINQLYSPELQPYKIAESIIKSQLDPAEDQQLWNSKMGLPHIVKGSGVTDSQIKECIKPYRMLTCYNGTRVVTMGIDVGWPLCHVEIDEWELPSTPVIDINLGSTPRVIFMETVHGFDDLKRIFIDFKVHFGVIDSQPERRLALQFANLLPGFIRCCSYEMGIEGKMIFLDQNEPRVKVDRTSWLDLSLGRFKRKDGIYLPSDTTEEYKKHIKAQIRVYQKDKNNQQTGRYITPVGEDHFGHARNYAEIAFKLAVNQGKVYNITSQVF